MFKKKGTKKKDDTNQIELVVLKTVNNNIEMAILKGILGDNDIPYIVKDHGAGGHMRIISGDSAPFRTDILVDKAVYERAKEIIGQITF
ncbi:DUF2007 domain-containing protein [Clostridium sp. D2Q-11]|uniref:DUF2007 domain-containing protein n=1 Tax=Anaeromonas frigoriresistens TaxID=2683708 RepID=A0A942UXM0_9FIRM|nr:DUF2007 domain-containing protein [Anaeromonas frigoriresistens]MBS4537492.1 DUF2007 domain-containing protein [Anaeromonas frigoriresistens]